MLKRIKCHFFVLFALGSVCNGPAASHALASELVSATVARMANDLEYLSSDELAGRDVGSEGIAKAGEFIAERFQQLGLVTDSFNGTPFQDFTIPGPAVLGGDERNTLRIEGAHELPELRLRENFTPLSLGSSGEFEGSVVFAGYGITAPDLGYDDYADVDVVGKVVIILRKEPGQNDSNSKFSGTKASHYAYFSSKELNAALHKVAALIIVNDSATVASAGRDELPTVNAAGSAVTDAKIPTLYCSRAVIDPLIMQAFGTSLSEIEAAIDSDAKPRSRPLSGITASGEARIEQSQTPVRNVVGFRPGTGELAEEFVVVGAHYDHVGMGGPGSLAPGTIEVHNGADDNASGTTTLLEVARRLVADSAPSRRGIVFVAFTGEEKGLLGSKHYIRSPRWPLENTVAMINLDMVGRLDNNSLTVYGTGTAKGFESMIDRINASTQFALDKEPAGFGPSDHSSFYEVGIPVFHFFTGLHNDYHRPSDDFGKANLEGMERIATMVTEVATELATAPQRPSYVKSSAVARIDRWRGADQGRKPRAILGIQLDPNSDLAKVNGLLAGSPAEMAGLRIGDLITRIGGEKIESIRDLHRVLSNKQPGDTISITLQRESESIDLVLTLAQG